ncbi:hypothetical protein [Lewinella sp. 4G2]|uniref:hypothetical protein n=1 Tax=Lewinella sp. 4G2 TaxID=1803372 RepID=UPI0007B4890D|nr:hypothetical protein [Lewinella sp. 4G2]OAV45228.1 hypothetical protein A3850_012310 [Lewinella sp. 4G2]
MRAIFRYLLLFAGIVFMINGCNGLVSSRFGTHSLRTLDLATLANDGLGDADYIAVTNAYLGSAKLATESGGFWAAPTIQRPLLTGEQTEAVARGETATPVLIAWSDYPAPATAQNAREVLVQTKDFKGLVATPAITNPAHWEENGVLVDEETRYLKIGEEPMAWYWNLLLFLGGLTLAALPEAMTFRQQQRNSEA